MAIIRLPFPRPANLDEVARDFSEIDGLSLGGGGGPTASYAVACLTSAGSQYVIPGSSAGWLPLTQQLVSGSDLAVSGDEIHVLTDGWYVVMFQVYASFTSTADMNLFFALAGSAPEPLATLTPPLGLAATPNASGRGTEQAGSITTPPINFAAGDHVHIYLSVDRGAGTVGLNTNSDATTQLVMQKVA